MAFLNLCYLALDSSVVCRIFTLYQGRPLPLLGTYKIRVRSLTVMHRISGRSKPISNCLSFNVVAYLRVGAYSKGRLNL